MRKLVSILTKVLKETYTSINNVILLLVTAYQQKPLNCRSLVMISGQPK